MRKISMIKVAGAPLEAGRALGVFGAEAVHRHLVHSPAWAHLMRWRGSERVAAMAALVSWRFPAIWQELQGLAEGLRLPFDDVFVWNCRGDLWTLSPDGCTTVMQPGSASASGPRRISHNEDGDPGFASDCAMAECAIGSAPAFSAFVYPGSIPGHTFAVTDAGLVMTVNNLRALHLEAGVPRMVLTRAMLGAASLEAAVEVLRQAPRAGGFHLTLAHRASPRMLSVEFSSAGCSVLQVPGPSLHANHAVHPGQRDLPQLITGSSGYRQLRGDAMLRQPGAVDALAILGDADNPRFPIHRLDAADGDNEITLATADIVIGPAQVDWSVYAHPLEAARFHLTDGHAKHHQHTTG